MVDGSLPPQDGDEVISGLLYRRIPNDHAHWVQQEQRPTGFNFRPSASQEHLSMQLGAVWSPEEILAAHPGFGLLEIDVAAFLTRSLRATYSPTLGTGHVSVWGLKGASKALLRELQAEIFRAWEPITQQLVYRRAGAP